MINYRKYLFVFIITAAVFATAFSVSVYLSNKKTANIKGTEDKISTDILSLETQFELLQEATCQKIDGTTLSDELDYLGDKLSYAESQTGMDPENLTTLRKYYAILQIKDFLLMKKVAAKCATHPVAILYFYSNKTTCDDCTKQSYVLTYLRKEYPDLRVYSFDYDLDISATKTLVSMYKVPITFPVLVIKDMTYSGYKSIEDLQKLVPELKPKTTAQPTNKTATTTAATTTVSK